MSFRPARPSAQAWTLLFAVILSALAGSACDRGPEGRTGRGSRAPSREATPRPGGVLRFPVAADPGSFNPLLTGPESLPEPWRRIYPVLLTFEPRGAAPPLIEGDLAHAWSWSPEQRTLTCTLQPGRFWQDTLRVTVNDVVRTYDAYRAAGWLARRTPGDSLPDPGLVSVSALDEATVRLTYGPGVSLWRALPAAGWPVLPARKLDDLSLPMLRANPLGREPLSASSFCLTDWRPGLNLWLGPNPTAFAGRRPLLERVEMDVCPGIDARILRVRLGRADLVTGVPVHRLRTLLEGDTIPRLHHDGIATVEMLCWNEGRALFTLSMRRAVSLAIDRERITRELLTWNGIACGGPAAGLLEPRGPGGDAEEIELEAARSDSVAAGPDSAPGATISLRLYEGDDKVGWAGENVSGWGGRPEAGLWLDSLLEGERGFGPAGSPDGDGPARLPSATVPAGDSATNGGEAASGTLAGSLQVGVDQSPQARDPLSRFDPQEANRLLDLAGWSERGPDGIRVRGGLPLRIELLYERDHELRERLAMLLESDLARVGIELAVRPVPGRTFRSRFRAGMFETALVGFRPPTIPDLSELWASWGYWNGGRYASPRVDSLCAALRREESPAALERLARRVESIVRREAPVTFLVYRDWTALLAPRVRDFRGTAADPLRGLEQVWLGDSTAAGP